MSDADAIKGLRERLTGGTEDRLGRALTDLFENPLLNGALGRASDAREKAAQAQELAMGALNLPSAADIERLTRRLRSVSQRLEGIEDGVHRLGRSLSGQSIDLRLTAIEAHLQTLTRTLEEMRGRTRGKERSAAEPRRAPATGASAKGALARGTSARSSSAKGASARGTSAGSSSAKGASARGTAARPPSAKGASAKGTAARPPSAKGASAKRAPAKRTSSKAPKAAR
jgi:hypothetical protein